MFLHKNVPIYKVRPGRLPGRLPKSLLLATTAMGFLQGFTGDNVLHTTFNWMTCVWYWFTYGKKRKLKNGLQKYLNTLIWTSIFGNTYILITTDLPVSVKTNEHNHTTMSKKDLMDAVVTTLHFYHSRAATRMIQSTEIAIVVDISQKIWIFSWGWGSVVTYQD